MSIEKKIGSLYCVRNYFVILKSYGKGKVVRMLKQATDHEGVWGIRDVSP